MIFEQATKNVREVSADELRALTARLPETQYVLVDVRQPEEYHKGHIPGALLLPLPELDRKPDKIPRHPHVYFYCHSGQRSRYAALLAMQAGVEDVASLAGGILAWRGQALTGNPAMRTVDLTGPVSLLLLQALELEKGAQRLYEALLAQVSGSLLEPAIRKLAQAEEQHGRAVHGLLRKAGGTTDSFEMHWEHCQGEVLEGGEPLEQVLERAGPLAREGDVSLLELALELELWAYDVYSHLAHRADSDDRRRTLQSLAQQEKQHARTVVRTFGDLAQALRTKQALQK